MVVTVVVEVVDAGTDGSVREVTVVTEGSSIEGSSRVEAGEGLPGGAASGVLLMTSDAGGVSGASDAGVGKSFAVLL